MLSTALSSTVSADTCEPEVDGMLQQFTAPAAAPSAVNRTGVVFAAGIAQNLRGRLCVPARSNKAATMRARAV